MNHPILHSKFSLFLNTSLSLIEERLSDLLSCEKIDSFPLFEAARYTILGTEAKRIRPLLILATAEIFHVSKCNALDVACAVEMVHTYSMIHDDLPCMDDDDYRRGRLTLHKKFNEGLAVLTGDYLLTYAFQILCELAEVDSEKRIKLISILSHFSGSHGMIGGQIMDIELTGKLFNLDTLHLLHLKKTGALFMASLEMGGVLGNASSFELSILKDFGKYLGLAFQAADDILDIVSSQMKHGSSIPSDVKNRKSTYVSLAGLDQAKKDVQSYQEKALASLKDLGKETSLLADIMNFVIERVSFMSAEISEKI